MWNDLFGNLFDLDGNGRTDPTEALIGFQILEEMEKESRGEDEEDDDDDEDGEDEEDMLDMMLFDDLCGDDDDF